VFGAHGSFKEEIIMARKKAQSRTTTTSRLGIAQRKAKKAEIAARRNAKAILDLQIKQEKLLDQVRKEKRVAAELATRSALRGGVETLSIIAQGDSWFSYDCGFTIVSDLEDMLHKPHRSIVNHAHEGRTLREMMSGSVLQKFADDLRKGAGGGPWDVVLLSGGGNDICGNGAFMNWINEHDPSVNDPDRCIAPAFSGELKSLIALVVDFAGLVARESPKALIFVNCYDFALPSGDCIPGKPVCVVGPWIRPAFAHRGYYKRGQLRAVTAVGEDLPTAIVRTVLQRFKTELDDVARSHANVRVVPTQGTLGQVKRLWANEMHPTNPGFRAVARVFYDTIKAQGESFASI
jgi:hypothetical protein